MNGLNIFVTNSDGSTELSSLVFAGLQAGSATTALGIRVYNAEEFDVEVNYLAASTINLIDVAAYGEDSSAANRAGLELVAESWLEARLLPTDAWTPIDEWANMLALGSIASGDYVSAQIRVNVPAGASTFGSMSFALAVHSRTEAPVISGFSPTSATQTADVDVTITGDYFKDDALVYLRLAGQTPIAGTDVTVTSSASITATFDLSDAISGAWTIAIRNPENVVGVATAAFTVWPVPTAAPTVTAIDPATAANDGDKSFTITGTGFLTGATVVLSAEKESDIPASPVNVVDSETISATFTLTGVGTGVTWDVTVTNTDMQSGVGAGLLTTTYPAPVVTSIDPTSVDNSTSIALTITGTGFVDTPQTRLRKSGETDIESYAVDFTDDTEIVGYYDVAGATPGTWSVVVDNYGPEGIGTDLLTITEAE